MCPDYFTFDMSKKLDRLDYSRLISVVTSLCAHLSMYARSYLGYESRYHQEVQTISLVLESDLGLVTCLANRMC